MESLWNQEGAKPSESRQRHIDGMGVQIALDGIFGIMAGVCYCPTVPASPPARSVTPGPS
jgi:hypothetical protein